MAGKTSMSQKTKNFFHIGGPQLQNISALSGSYDYHYLNISDQLNQEITEIEALDDDQINNTSSLFLLSADMMTELDKLNINQLPSYQVFYEDVQHVSDTSLSILNLKGAQKVTLDDGGTSLIDYINHNYAKPWGTSLDNSLVDINNSFDGVVTKKGSSSYTINGHYGDQFQQVMLWKNTFHAQGQVNFYAEMKASDDTEYFWRAYYQNNSDVNNPGYKDFGMDQLQDGPIPFDIGQSQFPVNFGLFVKGYGQLEIGDLHIRYHLEQPNFLAMGGRRLSQQTGLGEELGYYFNAGDMKPPFNVYFSGFRPAEGYEGRWMMGSLGSPFMLVYDPRLVGGSFYRGDELEESLINVIKDKLNLLGFTHKELILSGLSMGTYASFYYGAKLAPHAIIVGKPLANIGGLATNSRIFSPYDWDLAMDTIIHLEGELTQASAASLDDGFWQQFQQGDYSETTFIIAHMLQDTDRPFSRIFNYLKQEYPTAKVIHKGLEGRHNDDTSGVTSWFYKQYKELLQSDFGRKLTIEEDLDYSEVENE